MENFYRSILKQTLTQLKKMEQTKTILSSIKAIESIPFHETDLEDEYFVRLYFLIKNSVFWSNISDFSVLNENKIHIPKINEKIILSDEQLFDLVHSFYREEANKKIFVDFEKLFKNRRKNFKIYREPSFICYADSLYLPYKEQFFSRLNVRNNIRDVAIMAHEFGHGIQQLNNYNQNIFGKNKIFLEIISTFFELICLEHFSKVPEFSKQSIVSMARYHENTKKDAYFLNLYFASRKENEETPFFESKEKFLEYFSKDGVQIDDSFMYCFSYIIAIELYKIFIEDKARAWFLIEKIIEINLNLEPQQYMMEIINLGIIPNQNSIFFDELISERIKNI